MLKVIEKNPRSGPPAGECAAALVFSIHCLRLRQDFQRILKEKIKIRKLLGTLPSALTSHDMSNDFHGRASQIEDLHHPLLDYVCR